jgi:hypothetical protein
VIFLILLGGIGVYVVATSFSLQSETRAFAIGTGTILVILVASVLVREVVRVTRQPGPRVETAPPPGERGMASFLVALSWCIAFFLGVLFLGFGIVVPFWAFALLLWNRANRAATVVIPILLWALIKFGLESGLNTILFRGILFGDRPPTFW